VGMDNFWTFGAPARRGGGRVGSSGGGGGLEDQVGHLVRDLEGETGGYSSGILEQSTGTRNRVGIRLS
jgi:hypothetical protein